MPLISLATSVAANASSGNVLSGSPFEFVSQASIVSLAVTQPGAGAAITMDFQIGGESLAQQANAPNKATFPSFRDDTVVKAGAAPGERLFLNYNNTTGAAIAVSTLVEIQPL